VIISYKYHVYPDKGAERKLGKALDTCRWLYNHILEEISKSKENGVQFKIYDTQNMIPSLKLEDPDLRDVYSKVLQMVNYTLGSNIKGLYALKENGRKVGKFRFKGKGWYKTLNYNQSGFKIDQDQSILKLSKTGDVKIKLHRPIDVKGLKEKGNCKGLHRNIHDASWSKFLFMLSYKAESAGKKLIKVDPRGTSQKCSCCGSVVKKDLSDRTHEYPFCGFVCDRDYNASRNILISGMGLPLEPAEPEPLHCISVMQVLVMNQEVPPFRAG